MANFKPHKIVSSLPEELEANSVYYVRVGAGFDIYTTNSSGTIVAYALNAPEVSESTVTTYSYTNGLITSMTEVVDGTNRVTTYNYTDGVLTSFAVVHNGVTKTTTLTYTNGVIASSSMVES